MNPHLCQPHFLFLEINLVTMIIGRRLCPSPECMQQVLKPGFAAKTSALLRCLDQLLFGGTSVFFRPLYSTSEGDKNLV